MICPTCHKETTNPLQQAFDKIKGPLIEGEAFGLCNCPENDSQRETERLKR